MQHPRQVVRTGTEDSGIKRNVSLSRPCDKGVGRVALRVFDIGLCIGSGIAVNSLIGRHDAGTDLTFTGKNDRIQICRAERPVTDTRYACGHRQSPQSIATVKCIFTDARKHAVLCKGYDLQIVTVIKCIFCNFGHTCGNGNDREIIIVFERTDRDHTHGVRNFVGGGILTLRIQKQCGFVLVIQHTVLRCVVFIVGINGNACERRAIKCILIQLRHGCGDGEVFNIAVIKSVSENRCNRVGNRERRVLFCHGIQTQGRLLFVIQHTVCGRIYRIAFFHVNAFECAAIVKCIRRNTGHGSRDRNACQHSALKHIGRELRKIGGNIYVGKGVAVLECTAADLRHRIGKRNALQNLAIVECRRTDVCQLTAFTERNVC